MQANRTGALSSSLPAARPRSWYQFKASVSGVEIWLYDEIDATFGVGAKEFVTDIQRIGQTEPLILRIHSPGGDVFEGAAIANALKRHKGTVTTQIDGLCASIATMVALAGNTVRMAENGCFVLHNIWSAAVGDSDEMQNRADTLKKLNDNLISTYQAKTQMPRDQIAEMMSQESWLTAEEAQQFGFVDEITEKLQAAASVEGFDLRRFKNSPFRNQFSQQRKNMNTAPTQTEIEAKADEIYQAKKSRDKEIDEICAIVLKRDKKDFSALAAKFKDDDKSADEFARAIATSNEYKPREVIGSGRENFRGQNSIADIVINDERFRNMLKQHSGFPRDTRISIPVPAAERSFPRAALTTSSLDFGIDQRPGIVILPQQRLYVSDLCENIPTDGKDVRYLRENSFTNAATTVAEGSTKPEYVPDITKADATIHKIAAYVKIGEESLADFSQLGSLLNLRLPFQVELTEELQVLNGDGTGTNLTGILNTGGLQTQAVGPDSRLDALFKAITKIRQNNFMEPDGIVMHPTDFQTIRLMKDSQGLYFGGGPFTGSYGTVQAPNTGIPTMQYATLWGLPVAITVSMTQGTALVGAFKMAAKIYRRTGVMIEMSNSDQDDFIKNLVTIRCEERIGLAVVFPGGFCQVTGL
jgi:HK97 family phage major capsid protein